MEDPETRKVRKIPPSDWDWLVGLFFADGCKFKDQWHYAVVFTISMSEQHILEKLLRILRAAGLSPSVYKKQGRCALDVRSYGKNFFTLFPEESTWYEPKVPLALIAGLFDGDGCIGYYDGSERWVFSQAKYPHLARQANEIISPCGRTRLSIYVRLNGWLPISRLSVLRDARKNLRQSEFAVYCTRLVCLANVI